MLSLYEPEIAVEVRDDGRIALIFGEGEDGAVDEPQAEVSLRPSSAACLLKAIRCALEEK